MVSSLSNQSDKPWFLKSLHVNYGSSSEGKDTQVENRFIVT